MLDITRVIYQWSFEFRVRRDACTMETMDVYFLLEFHLLPAMPTKLYILFIMYLCMEEEKGFDELNGQHNPQV